MLLEDSCVRRALDSSRHNIPQVIHRIVRAPQVREDLGWIRQQSPAASHITLHRTLDVIAWRKQQEHCCQTAHSPEA